MWRGEYHQWLLISLLFVLVAVGIVTLLISMTKLCCAFFRSKAEMDIEKTPPHARIRRMDSEREQRKFLSSSTLSIASTLPPLLDEPPVSTALQSLTTASTSALSDLSDGLALFRRIFFSSEEDLLLHAADIASDIVHIRINRIAELQ